jgi:hypothetical protein
MTTELFIPANEICFSVGCNVFLLHHYEELENGKYPQRPTDYVGGGRAGRNTKAPFETAAVIKAELDMRLGQSQYPHQSWQLNRILGKLIIAELSWKQLEWDYLDSEVKEGLLFISSGMKRRKIQFRQWKYEYHKRRDDKNV